MDGSCADRRWLVVVALLAIAILPAAAQQRVVIGYPGPLNTPWLPLELAPKIGADHAEGLELVSRYVTGAAGLNDLLSRNIDFAVPGVPAAMSARARGGDVVAIMPLSDLPVYMLVVRAELKGKIKRIGDLAGRVVGVTSSTLAAKTTSHQVAELLLRQDGVPLSAMRIVSLGQNWGDVSAAFRSSSADAFVGFDPITTRLVESGMAYSLFDLHSPDDAAKVPGAGFLLAGIITRGDVIAKAPEKIRRVVAMMRRVLEWMATRSPEEIVAALNVGDAERRASLLQSLRSHPRQFSRDGKFSEHQIAETDRFFAAIGGETAPVTLGSMLDARWAGRKP